MQGFVPAYRQVCIKWLVQLLLLCTALCWCNQLLAVDDEVILADKKNFTLLNIALTSNEKAWLEQHHPVRVAVKSGWMPIEFKLENHNHKGISIDYLSKLSNLFNIDFIIVNDDENIDYNQIDMISGVSNGAVKNKNFQLINPPFLNAQFAIYTHSDSPKSAKISAINNLNGLKVAVFKHGPIGRELREKYPKLKLVYVDIADEAFEALQADTVDAYIGNELILDYHIAVHRLKDIKKAAPAPFNSTVSMAVRKDMPELASIFNKGFLALESDQDTILSSWKINDSSYDNALNIVFGALFILFSVALFKVYRLRQTIQKQQAESQQQIWYQANFDHLTKLPNRHLLENRLNEALKRADRSRSLVGVLFIDLDHFKKVNDQAGHSVGDTLLVDAANRINSCVRSVDTTARFGGDEFIIVITDTKEISALETTCQRILQSLEEPFFIENDTFHISASIGLAMYPQNGRNPAELLGYADLAMFEAKKLGRNRFQFFTDSMQLNSVKKLSITNAIRQALLEKQFILFYQPIANLKNGKTQKAEALIRWNHPTQGIISPADFIPLAEESGLINELGEWVFDQAIQDLLIIRNIDADFQISINVSPHQFNKPEYLLNWLNKIHELDIPGSSIAIEITEGLLLEPSSAVKNTILALREAGIELSIDDFGTGYSALAYLKKFHIEYVKIDKSFIQNLEGDAYDAILCEAIIDMAHKLGIKVVAEGIQTINQQEMLIKFGCDYGQGFYLARPERLSQLLKNFNQNNKK